MRYLFFILLFFTASLVSMQAQNDKEDNIFNKSRQAEGELDVVNGPPTTGEGGLEDDDLPIDDYIPLLVVTAIGFIIFKTQKKRYLPS